MKHIHLDAVGGIAGDMFAAALLDAFPELEAGTVAAAQDVAPVSCARVAHRDHVLAGSRFIVGEAHGHHHHHHYHWSDIRVLLRASSLAPAVRDRAVAIFQGLAEAEGQVHGIDPERVAFHEVGAADSIADIVAAAFLIDAMGPASWSAGPLPLGGGMVQTAHGPLPVPAPATALMLRGLAMVDDGIAGERVTPTGAAILRHLAPGVLPPGLVMAQSGIGFGTRTLPGRSNCLRALVFEVAAATNTHRQLVVVEFEVDDQSGEDLATGLEHIRATPGVHDALAMPAYGKKGRMTMHIQVLAAPDAAEAAVESCFAQTTTIGLRTRIVDARALPRRMEEAALDGTTIRVKIAERPGGATAKAERDDLALIPTHAERAMLRRRAEQAV